MHSHSRPKPEALVQQLAGYPEILFAVLYGSAVEGETFRDLDVGIMLDRAQVPANSDLNYAFSLGENLQRALRFPIDVRVLNDAPLPFRYNVSRGIPLVVHDAEAWFAFRERTWDEYLDFHPVAMAYLREMA
jgi:predicted nucleotidyltransferase